MRSRYSAGVPTFPLGWGDLWPSRLSPLDSLSLVVNLWGEGDLGVSSPLSLYVSMATLEAPYPSVLYKWPTEVCVLGKPGLVRVGLVGNGGPGEEKGTGSEQSSSR